MFEKRPKKLSFYSKEKLLNTNSVPRSQKFPESKAAHLKDISEFHHMTLASFEKTDQATFPFPPLSF
jgi:hypothetical protein